MRVLIGIKQAQEMEKLLEYRKEDMDFQVTDTKEEFLFHLPNNFDVVCVDAGLFPDVYPWIWIDEIKQNANSSRVSIALDADVYDSNMLSIIERLVVDYGFDIIPVQISVEKTAFAFLNFLFRFKQQETERFVHGGAGKFITVLPAGSGDGASTIALNTALAIASKTNLRIGLMDGNLKNPSLRAHLNITDRLKSNFQLRAKMQTATLDPLALEDASVVHKKFSNLYILPGTHRRETASDVTPEMIFNLMTVCRKTFHMTIMDVSSFADNAATICGVRYADERWFVSQPIYSSYRISWNEWLECYWRWCGLNSQDFKLVVNRVSEKDKLDDMISFLNMKVAGKIPNVSGGIGVRAVHDGIPLYLHTGPEVEAFTQAINQLASSVSDSNGSEFVAAAKEKKPSGFLRRLFS